MQLDPTTIFNLLKYLGYAAITVLTTIGGAGLLKQVFDRRWRIRDNAIAERFQADTVFKQSIVDRLAKVEEKFEIAIDELNAALVKNAVLAGENNQLTERLTRVTEENTQLEKRLAQATTEKKTFRNKVRDLTKRLEEVTKQLSDALDRIKTLEESLEEERRKNKVKK